MSGTRCALLIATLSCLPQDLFCQAVSGTINGYVYDNSEAAIAGAQVTITNTGTGTETVRATDARSPLR